MSLFYIIMLKILHVSSHAEPFLDPTPLSTSTKVLADKTATHPELSVRLLLPRFGVINERTNNIHETIRLSGINIPMGRDCFSLIVKVPSSRGAKLPIYFIDNEHFFERKGVFSDSQGRFYLDNDLRALFFCKSALAVIEKLAWAPDIVHCHGWMTSFIPMYLKKAYSDSPILKNTTSIYTLYEETFDHTFSSDILDQAKFGQLKNEDLTILEGGADFKAFTKLALQHADKATRTFEVADDPVLASTPYEEMTYIPHGSVDSNAYIALYKELQSA